MGGVRGPCRSPLCPLPAMGPAAAAAVVILALLAFVMPLDNAWVDGAGGAAFPITDGYYTMNPLPNADFCTGSGPMITTSPYANSNGNVSVLILPNQHNPGTLAEPTRSYGRLSMMQEVTQVLRATSQPLGSQRASHYHYIS